MILINLHTVIYIGWIIRVTANQCDENIIEIVIGSDLEGVDIQAWNIRHILLREGSFKEIDVV